MIDLIKQEIENLRQEVPKIADLNDDYLFSLVCYKYFFNDGRYTSSDHKECFVDGKNDGGIDLVSIYEVNDQSSLLLIQGKNISKLSNSQDVIDMLTKMSQTIADFYEARTAKYNQRLKRILKDKMAIVEDQGSNTELILFINTEVNDKIREGIENKYKNIDELSQYAISVFYHTDIEQKIQSVLQPVKFVKDGRIKYAKNDGIIKYTENGIIVNIRANSLIDLYDRFKDRGLFEQNFRYYIRNKRIDDSINRSLSKNREKFWFLNNGIIIGCKDFNPDGDEIKLYDFSIINGCQTTTLIGEYKGKKGGEDFVIPCKIVRPGEDRSEEDFATFIAEIAETSNSQKPISERDLKANRPEQRNLQTLLRSQDPKIYLEVKRGDISTKKKGLERWQKVKNDYLGQLILAFNLQRPGTAFSSKKLLFAEPIYYKVFKREHDKKTVTDLLKLNTYYEDFVNKNDFADAIEDSISVYGKFCIMALMGFLIKHKRGLLDLSKIKNTESWVMEIQKDNLKGPLFSDYKQDDFLDKLEALFLDIIIELMSKYNSVAAVEKTVPNFFKTDSKYSDVIIKHIVERFINHKMKKKEIDSYMQIF